MSYKEIKPGGPAKDTGKKFIDAAGNQRVIYEKVLSIGILPNAATKNVAHGESVDRSVGAYSKIELFAANGTATLNLNDVGVSLTETNLAIVAAGNQSAFEGSAIIEFIKPLA
ncbi:MAG: hypothetical protein WD512_20210 [Candidatus Paceibacterota bacterium]